MSKLTGKSTVLAVMMATSLLAVFSLLFTYNHVTSRYSLFKYAITIDAGSTHSKAILFKWKSDKLNETGLIEQVATCDIEPGISSFGVNRLEEAASNLLHCTRQLAGYLDRATKLEHTFLYLGATAGMRLLNASEPNSSAKIIQTIRDKFVEFGVQTKRVSIISGKEEGLFAWIAVNYLSGTLFGHSKTTPATHDTFGVLDMGGASAQIAQQIDNDATGDSMHIRLYGTNYTVHTYSNFCFGTEQALKRYYKITQSKHIKSKQKSTKSIEAPCLPKGLRLSSDNLEADNICTSGKTVASDKSTKGTYELVGSSHFQQCAEVVNEMLDPKACDKDFQYCFKQSSHPKEGTFYAISAFYYLTEVLNLRNDMENIDLGQYLNVTRKICESSQEELGENPKLHESFLNKYCFQLTYLHSTLTKVYNFDEKSWPNLRFTSFIKNTYLGWVLGFMIAESSAIPSEIPITAILLNTNLYTVSIGILFGVFLVCGICFWKQWKTKANNNNLPAISMSQVATFG